MLFRLSLLMAGDTIDRPCKFVVWTSSLESACGVAERALGLEMVLRAALQVTGQAVRRPGHFMVEMHLAPHDRAVTAQTVSIEVVCWADRTMAILAVGG